MWSTFLEQNLTVDEDPNPVSLPFDGVGMKALRIDLGVAAERIPYTDLSLAKVDMQQPRPVVDPQPHPAALVRLHDAHTGFDSEADIRIDRIPPHALVVVRPLHPFFVTRPSDPRDAIFEARLRIAPVPPILSEFFRRIHLPSRLKSPALSHPALADILDDDLLLLSANNPERKEEEKKGDSALHT